MEFASGEWWDLIDMGAGKIPKKSGQRPEAIIGRRRECLEDPGLVWGSNIGGPEEQAIVPGAASLP